MKYKHTYRYEALGTFIINFLFFSVVAANSQMRLLNSFHMALIPAVSYYVVYLLFREKCRAHFNPAFSFSCYITAGCSLKEFLLTFAAQLGGTAAAAIGAVVLFSNNMLKLELTARTVDFQNSDIPRLQVMILLLFITAFTAGVVYSYSAAISAGPEKNVSPGKRTGAIVPLCLILFLTNLITLPVTGTGSHPLRLLILTLFKKPAGDYGLAMFIVILGTVCGTLSYYKFLHKKESEV